MNYAFSARHNAFFPIADLNDYRCAGWVLDDIKPVSDDTFVEFSSLKPSGKIRVADDLGMPAWVDIPPKSHDELVQIAESEKNELITAALQTISLWQTQLQLGMISNSNKQKLIEWMEYIEAVKAVDTNTAPHIILPAQPEA